MAKGRETRVKEYLKQQRLNVKQKANFRQISQLDLKIECCEKTEILAKLFNSKEKNEIIERLGWLKKFLRGIGTNSNLCKSQFMQHFNQNVYKQVS